MIKNIHAWLFENTNEESNQIIALHDYHIIYFPIPKVACSSLKSVCVDLLNMELPEDTWKADVFHSSKYDHLINKSRVIVKRSRLSELAGYWRFAFVRNPWDRLVSCYSEKIRDDGDPENFVRGVSKVLIPYGVFKSGMSFSEFARAVAEIPDRQSDPHLRSQHTFIYDKRRKQLEVDFVGRFETLGKDFEELSKRVKVSVALPHMLASKRKNYTQYYDSKLIEIVGERYQKDIQLFSYGFSG